MANVNFYLKHPKKESSLIVMKYYLNGKNFFYSFNRVISSRNWDSKKQMVKRSSIESMGVNLIMDKIRTKVKDLIAVSAIKKETLTDDYLRLELDILLGKTEQDKMDVTSFIPHLELYIKEITNTHRPNTIKKFTSLKNHVEDFEKKALKRKVLIRDLDEKLYNKFTDFLIEQRLVNQTIGKYVQAFKVVINKLVYNKTIAPVQLSSWKVNRKTGTIIVLSPEEVKLIEKVKLPNEKLNRVRDLFLFAANTALRYSDLLNLKKENIKGKYIHLTTIKTSEDLVIPMSDNAIAILKKYDNELPIISNQKANDYIKEICKLAGINKMIQLISYSGTHRIQSPPTPKHELISFHVARKTCITNLLSKGLPTEIVQRIVGIEDYRTLKYYINLNDHEKIYDKYFQLVNKQG